MPQPTRPQLAIYAAAAIAVLLIGARFLRSQEGAAGGGGLGAAPAATAGALAGAGGAAAGDGAAADPAAGGAGDGTGGVDPSLAGGEASDPPLAPDGEVLVDVKGAVRRPGVYRLAAGARAIDAVRRAGGVTRQADRLGVNLAARVTDGGEVVVPRRGRSGAAGLGGGAAGAGAGAASAGGAAGAAGAGGAGGGEQPLAIDLNTATAAELEQLDGVGPAIAARIIAYREANGGFSSIDELEEVSGIGPARLAAIRAQLGL